MGDTLLKERDAVECAVCFVDARQQQDENGSGTDQKSVDVYGNDLCQTLFRRMGYFCRGGSIWGRTHTCLIGEESAFDTVDHAGSGKAAEDCLEVEC